MMDLKSKANVLIGKEETAVIFDMIENWIFEEYLQGSYSDLVLCLIRRGQKRAYPSFLSYRGEEVNHAVDNALRRLAIDTYYATMKAINEAKITSNPHYYCYTELPFRTNTSKHTAIAMTYVSESYFLYAIALVDSNESYALLPYDMASLVYTMLAWISEPECYIPLRGTNSIGFRDMDPGYCLSNFLIDSAFNHKVFESIKQLDERNCKKNAECDKPP